MPSIYPIVSQAVPLSNSARNAIAYDSINQQLASIRVLDDRSLDVVISDKAGAKSDKFLRVSCEPEERFDAPKLVGLGWIDDDHLVAAIDFRLMVWNTNSGRLEAAMPQHNPNRLLPSYRAIAFQRNHCVTITEEGTLDHWRWTGKELVKCQPGIELRTSGAVRLAWHPSGDYVIVGTQSGAIRSIDLRHRQSVFAEVAVHSGEICGAAWCDAERLVTASRDGKLALWQHRSGVLEPYVAWDSRSGVTAIDVTSDGKLCYVASASESISVFDLASLDAEFAKLGIVE